MKRKRLTDFLSSLLLMHAFVSLLALGVLVFALASCKSHSTSTVSTQSTQRSERVTADTVYLVLHSRDSITTHDSVYIKEYQKGDTVFVTQYRDRLRFVTALRHDTVHQLRIETRRDTLSSLSHQTIEKESHPRPFIVVLLYLLLLCVAGVVSYVINKKVIGKKS